LSGRRGARSWLLSTLRSEKRSRSKLLKLLLNNRKSIFTVRYNNYPPIVLPIACGTVAGLQAGLEAITETLACLGMCFGKWPTRVYYQE
jgi:hypothetical protein